jgi:hypothetical protein
MGNVCNEEALVEVDVGHDTSRRSATGGVCVGVVNSEVHISRRDFGKASLVGDIIIQVLDKSNVSSVLIATHVSPASTYPLVGSGSE